jgi:transcriptional regulator with XRE-family HTH domain
MDTTFADYLREKMAEMDLNDSQLARKIDVHRGTVGRWLNEGILPEYPNMKKAAEGLGVPIQEVIDAVEGRYKPLTEMQRQALTLKRKYTPEDIAELVKELQPERYEKLKMEAYKKAGKEKK